MVFGTVIARVVTYKCAVIYYLCRYVRSCHIVFARHEECYDDRHGNCHDHCSLKVLGDIVKRLNAKFMSDSCAKAISYGIKKQK